jgi:hypothetical protein
MMQAVPGQMHPPTQMVPGQPHDVTVAWRQPSSTFRRIQGGPVYCRAPPMARSTWCWCTTRNAGSHVALLVPPLDASSL